MIISLIKSKFLPKKFQKELMLMRINVKIRRSIKKKKKKKKKNVALFVRINSHQHLPSLTLLLDLFLCPSFYEFLKSDHCN